MEENKDQKIKLIRDLIKKRLAIIKEAHSLDDYSAKIKIIRDKHERKQVGRF